MRARGSDPGGVGERAWAGAGGGQGGRDGLGFESDGFGFSGLGLRGRGARVMARGVARARAQVRRAWSRSLASVRQAWWLSPLRAYVVVRATGGCAWDCGHGARRRRPCLRNGVFAQAGVDAAMPMAWPRRSDWYASKLRIKASVGARSVAKQVPLGRLRYATPAPKTGTRHPRGARKAYTPHAQRRRTLGTPRHIEAHRATPSHTEPHRATGPPPPQSTPMHTEQPHVPQAPQTHRAGVRLTAVTPDRTPQASRAHSHSQRGNGGGSLASRCPSRPPVSGTHAPALCNHGLDRPMALATLPRPSTVSRLASSANTAAIAAMADSFSSTAGARRHMLERIVTQTFGLAIPAPHRAMSGPGVEDASTGAGGSFAAGGPTGTGRSGGSVIPIDGGRAIGVGRGSMAMGPRSRPNRASPIVLETS